MTAAIPDLLAAANEALGVLDRAGLRACLIGGLVVPRWGEPRATTDADLSVLAPYGQEKPVIETSFATSPRADRMPRTSPSSIASCS